MFDPPRPDITALDVEGLDDGEVLTRCRLVRPMH
jgi:hypothetical protein